MKALTISQPYASLIASGEKWVENRTWETKYRGYLAIHAGKGQQYLDRKSLVESEYPTSCVLAVAELIACMPLASMREMSRSQRIPKTDLTLGDVLDHVHAEGPWCWILRNVRRYREPIQASGKQGLWEWNEPDLAELEL